MNRSGVKQDRPVSGKQGKGSLPAWKDRLDPQDYAELRETFDLFDEDKSGTIDPAEISKVLTELGLQRRNPTVLRLINGLLAREKALNFEEFIDALANQVGQTKTRDGLSKVFAMYDTDGTGLIDFEKIKAITRSIGDPLNDDQILQMMHNTCVNCRTSSIQQFNFEEFYTVVTKHSVKKDK